LKVDEPTASKYTQAGVDLQRAAKVTKRIGELALSTFNERVLRGIGTFGALYHIGGVASDDTVLVSSVDGVGTKLKIAFITGRHDTIGRDLVNHCVNDILAMGALPLYFMDYLAVGSVDPDVIESVVLGIREGCRSNHIPLIGGETAEMPGFYAEKEYDLVGFIVGAVDKGSVFDGARIAEGDKIVGLPSNGLHTNGYSLVRRVLIEDRPGALDEVLPGMKIPLQEELLKAHRSYLKDVAPLLDLDGLHGMAHITGGGIIDNVPRILPGRVNARIDTRMWDRPAIFGCIQDRGGVSRDEMYRVFNMGIGFILVVASSIVDRVIRLLEEDRYGAMRIGEIVPGNGQVELIS
jgi:phosphoribosylformylglycinamidine cyclo-ligase